jgi:predicted nucleotidyltransferase component of viral defense system
VTLNYRFESETKPVTPLRLKIETNTREHFCVLGPRRVHFMVDSPWHSGAADVLTYELEELLGTKLRALYQRKKGRDLFDLSEALTRNSGLDAEKVVTCFLRYLESDGLRITRAEFENNLAEKIDDKVFLSDVPPLLATGVSFDPVAALERVKEAFISRLPESASKRRKARNRP